MNDFSKKQPGTARQADLAAIFGVSRVTVSRALRRTGQVKPELEAKIIAAAQERGYSTEANFDAVAMRQRRDGKPVRTNIICALMPLNTGTLRDSPFQLRLVAGVQQTVEQSVYDLLLVLKWRREYPLPRIVTRGQVDGLIWGPSEQDLRIHNEPIPVPAVTLFYAVPGTDILAVDDQTAMREMGEYLAHKRHRRVAFIGPESELARARLKGLRAGLAIAGGSVRDDCVRMDRYVMGPDLVLPRVRAVMARRQALPEAERFTAIAAYNDYIALTVMRCLRDEYGLRVPQDMSITGFDGLNAGVGDAPRLMTAAIPLEEIGAEAVRMLEWRMSNPREPQRREVLHAPVVEGETVCSVR